MNKTTEKNCFCDSGKPFKNCCEVFLNNPYLQATEPLPKTAEQLMRSRYSAYVLHNEVYLLNTWYPSTRPLHIDFDPDLRWLGLKIITAARSAQLVAKTNTETKTETVEFIARYKTKGHSAARLHEVSRFIREPVDSAANISNATNNAISNTVSNTMSNFVSNTLLGNNQTSANQINQNQTSQAQDSQNQASAWFYIDGDITDPE